MKIFTFLFLLLIYNPLYSQYNNPKHLLLYGSIVKTTETSITLSNIKVLNGLFDKEEITIKLSVGIGVGYRVATLTEPTSDWIGKNILIETVYVEQFKGYYTTGKYGTPGFSQSALTPDGHTLYFLTQENNIKNGITDTNTDIISAIQKVKKVNNIKGEIEKLKEMDKIVNDSNEYVFIREYLIWEMNKLNSKNICYDIYKTEIISSYIDNEHIPLNIRLKARDFYPNYSDYSKYYHLIYDIKNSNNVSYQDKLGEYKDYYVKELLEKIDNEEKYIELINQNLNK